jgi:hypothetical protein
VPIATFNRILNRRDGAFHRYWKVATTKGSTGSSHWKEMREGTCCLASMRGVATAVFSGLVWGGG